METKDFYLLCRNISTNTRSVIPTDVLNYVHAFLEISTGNYCRCAPSQDLPVTRMTFWASDSTKPLPFSLKEQEFCWRCVFGIPVTVYVKHYGFCARIIRTGKTHTISNKDEVSTLSVTTASTVLHSTGLWVPFKVNTDPPANYTKACRRVTGIIKVGLWWAHPLTWPHIHTQPDSEHCCLWRK